MIPGPSERHRPAGAGHEDPCGPGAAARAGFRKDRERSRTGRLRSRARRPADLRERRGAAPATGRAAVDSPAPAYFDDALQADARMRQLRGASPVFARSIARSDGGAAVGAVVRIACIDAARRRPCGFPEPLLHDLPHRNEGGTRADPARAR